MALLVTKTFNLSHILNEIHYCSLLLQKIGVRDNVFIHLTGSNNTGLKNKGKAPVCIVSTSTKSLLYIRKLSILEVSYVLKK